MNARRYQPVAKAAAEAFTIGAGVVSFIFDIVASFFRIPSFVKWVVSSIIGLIAACFGCKNAMDDVREGEKRQTEEALHQNDLLNEVKHDLALLRAEKNTTAKVFETVKSSKDVSPEEMYRESKTDGYKNSNMEIVLSDNPVSLERKDELRCKMR